MERVGFAATARSEPGPESAKEKDGIRLNNSGEYKSKRMVNPMTTETKEITNDENVIDVRDITERVEYLEDQPTLDDDGACYSCGSHLKDGDEDHELDCEVLELQRLNALLDELCGNGGDHDWRDNWYPLILVRDSCWKEFAQDEAESLDLIDKDARWPYICIDWDQAADELKNDYSTVEFDGVTYWYR